MLVLKVDINLGFFYYFSWFKVSCLVKKHGPSLFKKFDFKKTLFFVQECGGTIEGTSGTIQTPGYPHGYPHRHICVWNIIGPPGRSIKLTFSDFDLEPPLTRNNQSRCSFDYAYVSKISN